MLYVICRSLYFQNVKIILLLSKLSRDNPSRGTGRTPEGPLCKTGENYSSSGQDLKARRPLLYLRLSYLIFQSLDFDK